MNPFIFPKSRHVREESPPQFTDYRLYKSFLRAEFEKKCVYCRKPDTMGGLDSFGADHYRPKAIFPQLVASYSNLFYCCNTCNRRKGKYWPATAKAAVKFIPNPCDHEMIKHLRFNGSLVESRSQAGQFTSTLLDLNDPERVSFRETIVESLSALAHKTGELNKAKSTVTKWRKTGKISVADAEIEISEIDSALNKIKNSVTKLCGL